MTNVIEDCIHQNLAPICELKSNLFVSSRTDKGVHALSNTGHFDLVINQKYFARELQNQDMTKIYSDLMLSINSQLIKDKYPVRYISTVSSNGIKVFVLKESFRSICRILKIKKVKPDFISRHAKARTYFYRLGLLENGKEALKDFEDFQRVESALNPTASVSKITGASTRISLNNFICALEKQFITEIR